MVKYVRSLFRGPQCPRVRLILRLADATRADERRLSEMLAVFLGSRA